MRIVDTAAELRTVVRNWRSDGVSIAFVPTMGNLHDGHMRLVAEAKKSAQRVIVSIFVNPAQFGAGEDFASYPRTPDADIARLSPGGTDLLFLPAVAEIYPAPSSAMTYVEVPGISDDLCGHFRPLHFRGVATVVCKLFHLVQPDVALLGQKDFQQLTIIKRLVTDLNLPIRIESVETVREPSGLALSSRNAYLSAEEKNRASGLYQSLLMARQALVSGNRNFADIELSQIQSLVGQGFTSDYFSIRRQSDLAMPTPTDRELVVLVAARLGKTRLIDNVCVVL